MQNNLARAIRHIPAKEHGGNIEGDATAQAAKKVVDSRDDGSDDEPAPTVRHIPAKEHGGNIEGDATAQAAKKVVDSSDDGSDDEPAPTVKAEVFFKVVDFLTVADSAHYCRFPRWYDFLANDSAGTKRRKIYREAGRAVDLARVSAKRDDDDQQLIDQTITLLEDMWK
jgi:hypothetical protein